jgi:large subunit ribosomal protein L5
MNMEETYKKEIAPKLMEQFGVKNTMAVPRLTKVVINCGMGEALTDKKSIERMAEQLAIISGQKPVIVKARKAISAFKVRIGDAIGIKITLRGKRMYDFFTKFVGISLPRVRDFRGVPTGGFDGNGNYTLGVKEQIIFPELEYSMIDKSRGFEISFVTTAPNDEQARALLTVLGMPFSKE